MKTNSPNPLVPQGTFPQARKSHVRIAFFSILALHLILLGALLVQGCKRTGDSSSMQQTNASTTPEFDQATNVLAIAPAPLPPTTPETDPAIVAQATPITPTPVVSGTPVSAPPVAHVTPRYPVTSSNPTEPAGAPTAVTSQSTTTHVVLRGETFTTIGKKYGVSSRAIAKANPRVDARSMKVGDKLIIPAPTVTASTSTPTTAPGTLMATAEGTVYVVKSGDNLSTIAKHFGTSVTALRKANTLKNDTLKVGDKLKIPAAVRADSTTSAPPRFP